MLRFDTGKGCSVALETVIACGRREIKGGWHEEEGAYSQSTHRAHFAPQILHWVNLEYIIINELKSYAEQLHLHACYLLLYLFMVNCFISVHTRGTLGLGQWLWWGYLNNEWGSPKMPGGADKGDWWVFLKGRSQLPHILGDAYSSFTG